MPFQQRTNTSCYLAIPTRGFMAVVSVFRGTPPSKPFNCKIRFALRGGAMSHPKAHHVSDQPMLVLAKFCLSLTDITWMSLCCFVLLSFVAIRAVHFREQKTLPTFQVSRVRENRFRPSEPAYAKSIQIDFGLLPDSCHG